MLIPGGTPKAKAILWDQTDVEVRQRGDQRGLDTPVVHAVNDDLSVNSKICDHIHFKFDLNLNMFCLSVLPFILANALKGPPEEYGRKTKTQRNRRGLTQVVEHVV